MKLIYTLMIWYEGLASRRIRKQNSTSLMRRRTCFFAKSGKTGLVYTVGKGIAPESGVAVISILGYSPVQIISKKTAQ